MRITPWLARAAALLVSGCAGGTAAGPPVIEVPVAQAPGPDQLLQARLQEAARMPWRSVPNSYPSVGRASAPGPIRDLQPFIIQKIVRASFDRFRGCYKEALGRKPDLTGRVSVRFTIQRDGTVAVLQVSGDITDEAMKACVAKHFAALTFPKQEGRGVTTVTYPISFSPSEDASPPRAAEAAPPAPPRPQPRLPEAPSPATEGPWPILTLEGGRLLLDGVALADGKPILAIERVTKLDALFTALTARREAHRARHPGARFAGVIGLRAAPDTPLVAFKSAFQTAAFAGYETSLWQLSTDPARIFELRADIPSGPAPAASPGDEPRVERVLHVLIHDDGIELAWRLGAGDLSTTKADDGNVGEILCRGFQTYGEHTAPDDGERDLLAVRASSSLPARALLSTLQAAESCRRLVPDAAGKASVFGVVFSAR